jgi:hypothetical protein
VQFSARANTAALVLGALLFSERPTDAHHARAGATFNIPVIASALKRFPDVAYDSTNGVYLVVHGNGYGGIGGAFVSADGVPIGGPFPIAGTAAFVQTPRVSYAPGADVFLVTWLDTRLDPNRSSVWGRIIRYSGGGPAYISGDILISTAPGGAHSEMGPAVEYSTGSGLFLVAWMQYGPSAGGTFDIRAQLVTTAGQLAGGEIPVTLDTRWQAQPSIAYNPDRDEFMVVFGLSASDGEYAAGRRIAASTGALVDPVALPFHVSTYLTVPEVQYHRGTGRYLVAWFTYAGGALATLGVLVNGDGSVASAVFPIVIGNSTYDALDLSYNAPSGVFLAVSQDGFSAENIAIQISQDGVPEAPIIATGSGGTGNFGPRIAASTTRPEWMLATARSFAQVVGQRLVTGSVGGPPPPPPPPPPPTSVTIDLTAANAPNGSWFFAEGAQGSNSTGFETYYLISNPNAQSVDVRAYLAKEGGTTVETTIPVAAHSRRTVRLGDIVGGGSYGGVFQSKTPGSQVFVERAMYWGSNWEGGTAAAGVSSPSYSWYFAEGSTNLGFFDNYFLLFNPTFSANATVTATFYLDAGQWPVQRTYTVPAQGRLTIHANAIPELTNTDFSTVFTSDVPIVAERSMYWGPGWTGGTNTVGATSPSWRWFFAEGAAQPGFDTFYTVLNPHPTAVTFAVTYFIEGQGPYAKLYTVPATSRFTIWLTAEVGYAGSVGADFQVWDGTLVVERSTYWGAGWVEGANSVGVTSPAMTWQLPEGTTAGSFETFLLIANPNDFPITARVTCQLEGGGVIINDYAVPALGRKTVYMNNPNDFAALQGRSFSTTVQSFWGSIVVEHAIYWTPAGANYWRGGSSSFGIPQ